MIFKSNKRTMKSLNKIQFHSFKFEKYTLQKELSKGNLGLMPIEFYTQIILLFPNNGNTTKGYSIHCENFRFFEINEVNLDDPTNDQLYQPNMSHLKAVEFILSKIKENYVMYIPERKEFTEEELEALEEKEEFEESEFLEKDGEK